MTVTSSCSITVGKMDERHQKRQETVDQLTAFIDSSHHQLDELLSRLQWDKEDILNQNEKKMKLCPINSHHLVPETCLEQHTLECELVAEGYSRQEQKEIPRSNSFFYERSSSVVPVFIDKEAQEDILSRVPGSSAGKDVPRTVDRMDKAFTSAEKLAIHVAVLEKSKASREKDTVSLQDLEFNQEAPLKTDESAKPKTRLEILAEMRDYKRRRQSYRAKNVHITRRSQTEIMREVIEAQMNELQQALQGDDRSVQNSEPRGRSSSPDKPRSRDASHSPLRSRPRPDDRWSQHPQDSRGRGTSNRSSYEDEADYHPVRHADARSRDRSRSPRPSSSRKDSHQDRHGRCHEISPSSLIKVEKIEGRKSHESSGSPRPSEPGTGGDSTSRSSTPLTMMVPYIKVERDTQAHSPSQGRGDEREKEDRRERHHSKHKHHHKHKKHHSRDSR
ncbi:U11/U12 small nuclear ribonucleoprotein 48 kDa protein-like isoform X2 [Acanthaster planci]|uniref:U11/U12 small nuclear ribonucleoprotein 48 kDa protein-like isoform X2 n=1 Tax=Acanthaster planci TaxID=133434 RepID=A0A8B7XT07_ACAPL|nr:U11/U12 small nuclear ribonucleoprotein 48 kDa protein-like isoform X2 [Acanthaster planci]